ncbi:hypothetical protein GOODEAATRI_012296 [Goodea atripinnis]|uniref:Uncharacterized protein n=1 Tax=Goodea atripinnis TaxID=208336 RepID=A0ABV0NCD6_9TELE
MHALNLKNNSTCLHTELRPQNCIQRPPDCELSLQGLCVWPVPTCVDLSSQNLKKSLSCWPHANLTTPQQSWQQSSYLFLVHLVQQLVCTCHPQCAAEAPCT